MLRRVASCFLAIIQVISVLLMAGPGRIAATPADEATQALQERLRHRLEPAAGQKALSVNGERIQSAVSTRSFYEARLYAPAWALDTDRRSNLRDLIQFISGVSEEGLDPAHYHAANLISLSRQLGDKETPSSPGDRVDLELLATDAFLLLASHCLAGHLDPESIDPEWKASRRGADLPATLEKALARRRIGPTLRTLLPPQAGYARLRDLLRRYRESESRAPWPTVSPGPKLEVGSAGARVLELKERLRISGDLTRGSMAADAEELFDDGLDAAVRRFQSRHGLEEDGVVGPATLEALNVSRARRIRQIVINLERWRWLPQDLGARHVRVNIAGFDLEAVHDDERELAMRVIVGRDYRRTPVFSDQITYMVLNPSWEIPKQLAVQDVLPQVKKNPAYLQQMGIKVLQGWGGDEKQIDPASVRWNEVSASPFPYRLRQLPGPLNSLGRMKFMFPNPFNIYLHDTPARELFAKSSRALSSGCIRVEQPLKLAEWLLHGGEGWNAARIQALVDAGAEKTVRLPMPVPVHLLHWTAWVDDEGQPHFRKDLYGRDARVEAGLAKPPPSPV